ncbi:MAG TPA: 3-dehydroquinate synthase [Ferruginibacter sp.]|nr:3-dehydroquinate synthase [Ferruginibacter sp.]HMP20082.1 3-dehydroquinate synthase [Ferruginibacter sp.]
MALQQVDYTISGKTVSYYFDAGFAYLENIVSKEKTILVTDEHLYAAQASKFEGWRTIIIKAGEEYKQQAAVDDIIRQLIELEADRNTFIVGVGGGVVTDITGYTASVYMRGLKFGFVPTTVLAMVDAAIGGKNGVDVGVYKNLVGVIKQPSFLLFDYSLLQSLPQAQWINGFAEVIKHACIRDANLFALLEQHCLDDFQQDTALMAQLIEKNVHIKTSLVAADELEQNERRLLNFGHTLGHAIENIYQLPHGHAVSIGMMAACAFSEAITGFAAADTLRIEQLIEKYQLPTSIQFDRDKVWSLLKLDKKRMSSDMNFILLKSIGEGIVHKMPLTQLQHLITERVAATMAKA